MPTYFGRGSFQSAPLNSGKCQNWNDEDYGTAWPVVTPGCNQNGCGLSLQSRTCNVGSRLVNIFISQPCPLPRRGVNNVKVKDCGPDTKNNCNKNYRCCTACPVSGSGPAICDVTPKTFVWLASLTDASQLPGPGSIPVRVSW